LNLYIYSGKESKNIEDYEYTYCLDIGKVYSKNSISLNDEGFLNKIAKDHAQVYSDFIFSLNAIFKKNNLKSGKDLSLYFLSDISNKRTEIFDSYNIYCNVTLLNKLIKKYKIKNITIDKCSNSFIDAIKSSNLNTNFKITNIVHTKNRYLWPILKNFIFFSKFLFIRVFENIFFSTQLLPTGKKNFFLTRYPKHLDNKFKEDKFGDCIKKNDYLLVNILTDGIHQNINFINYFKFSKHIRNYKKAVILDSFTKIADIFSCFLKSIKIKSNFRCLFKERYILDEINLTSALKEEISLSVIRIPRLLLLISTTRSFSNFERIKEFNYYLHEYVYGRAFTYVFKNFFSNVALNAYQHGPASHTKMLYKSGRDELKHNADGLNNFFIPDKVNCEENYSKNVYESSGYINVVVMDRVYRLSYLRSIKIKSRRDAYLIAPGLHDGEDMMNYLEESIRENPKRRFVLKPHPRSNNSYIKLFLKYANIDISSGSIYQILGCAKKVYCTYSSVAIEASILGIDTEVISLPGRVNESPLIDPVFKKVCNSLRY